MHDIVGEALKLLLSRKQIDFVEARTFAGPSRKQVLRKIVALGIAEWSNHTVIQIKPIPEKEARYDTVGDWLWDANGNLQILLPGGGHPISDKETFLVALHELVEAALCYHAGITQANVDAFDMAFTGEGEPGDHVLAPYRRQHRQACLVEFLVADMLGYRHGRVE